METITKEELIKTDPELKNRPYQIDALLRIFLYAKCLVKMFCGTGKSKIITNVIIHAKKGLSVVVFPSLALIRQYSADYLNNEEYVRHFKKHKTLNVSSLSEKKDNKNELTAKMSMNITTDPEIIKDFLKGEEQKIILVTYQSYQVLLDCLEGQKIGLVCYDEAHHVTSPETQKLVFGTSYFEKEVFFTATPKNENGITMFDREYTEKNMCGPVAYDYTYLQGLNDEVLNAFDICIDMYTDDNNASIYTAIARAIISRNNNRVLSFHSGVNGESNTNVWNFVKETEFRDAFNKVIETEFPEKAGYYKKITFKGMDGTTPSTDRVSMLDELYNTPDNEIYIITSCETIGEGVDTKKANMCVFADPKSSICKIIQNIGRVVRKQDKRSTILIPCWVNMENYAAVKHDRVKTDELIREQMRTGNGDYECILNVLAALKQEDPELYDMCLNYPNRKVKETSLQKQGFCIADYEDVSEADLDDSEYSSEEVEQMKTDGEPLEIHTNETIERFNEESEESLRRLYHDEEEDVYKPIVRITDASEAGASEAGASEAGASDADTDESVSEAGSSEGSETDADDRQIIQPPVKPKNRVSMSFHLNADVQMLWGVKGELDFSKKFCTAVIECEVTKIDQMELAIGIVERAKAREANGGNLLPNFKYKKNKKLLTEVQTQENTDYRKIRRWKYAIQGQKNVGYCSVAVMEYLDEQLPNWRLIVCHDKNALIKANEIIDYVKNVLGGRLPTHHHNSKDANEIKEDGYARKLDCWNKILKGGRGKCSVQVRKLLDTNIPGWNDKKNDWEQIWLKLASEIVEYRVINKYEKGWVPKQNTIHSTPNEALEHRYAGYFSKWRGKCPDKLRQYLDDEFPGWKIDTADEAAYKLVVNIIEYIFTVNRKLKRTPLKKETVDNRTPVEIMENTYMLKLDCLKKAINNGILTDDKKAFVTKDSRCSVIVKKLLDDKLPGWSDGVDYDEDAIISANEIVNRILARQKVNKKNLKKNMPKRADRKRKEGPDKRTSDQIQQNADYSKLVYWRKALNGELFRGNCPDEVRDYLDKELPGWRPTEITTPPPPPPAPATTPPPPAPPVKRKLKLKVKVPAEPKSTQPKKQSAIPIASEHSEAEKYPHHFPPPSEIGLLHKTYLKMRSDTLHQKFKSDPQLWREYHATRKRNFASYDPASIPSNQIIRELEKIQTKRQKVVIDMGCGEAPIAHHFLSKNDNRFTFKNYDHQSGGDPLIEEVDISVLPLEDASVEIAIMSLALWGTPENCTQYIKEAYRVLESGGKFYISDSTKKWSPEPLTPENGGELLRTLLTTNGFKIISEDIGMPFCLFVCAKIY